MELSPEEKRRIYEEEKFRLEAQEKVKKELETKKKSQSYIGCLSLIVIIVVIGIFAGWFSSGDETKSTSSTSTSSSTYDLKASVRFTGTQFIITNNDNFDWTNVKFEVNSGILKSGFVLRIDRLRSGETYTAGAMQFAKGDGTRFNPISLKTQNFYIWCDTPLYNQPHGSWYGSWE